MKILFYLDPFLSLTANPPRAIHFHSWMPVIQMSRALKEKYAAQGQMAVVIAEPLLWREDLHALFNANGIRVACLTREAMQTILRTTGTTLADAVDGAVGNPFRDAFDRAVKGALDGWTPEMVVSSASLPKYLQSIFPASLFIEQMEAPFATLTRHTEVFPVCMAPGESREEAMRNRIASTTLSDEDRDDLHRYRESFRKYVIGPTAFDRRILDPEGRYEKIVFYHGLLEHAGNHRETINRALSVLPPSCAVAYLIEDGEKAVSETIAPENGRVINLAPWKHRQATFFLKALGVCDALVGDDPERHALFAAIMDKPYFTGKDGETRSGLEAQVARRLDDLRDWSRLPAGERDQGDAERARRDALLCHVLTHRLPCEYFNASPDNVWKYYHGILERWSGKGEGCATPVSSTLEEAINDNLIAAVCPRYFHREFERMPNGYEILRGHIMDPAITTVGFDMFDTLLRRPVVVPTEIFELLQEEIDALVKSNIFQFKLVRTSAEQVARHDAFQRHGHHEVTFQDIYDKFAAMTGLPAEVVDRIRDRELEVESRNLTPRFSALSMFKLAKAHGKRTLVISDMYHSKAMLTELLEKNGYRGLDAVYVSCEHGVSKHDEGRLFAKAIAELELEPARCLFVGDNIHADIAMARKAGMKTLHFMSAVDRLKTIPALYECFQYYLVHNFITHFSPLGVFINKVLDNPFIPYSLDSFLNSSLYVLGYGVGGPLMMALACWLVREAESNEYDLLSFVARDGYLLQEIYDNLNEGLFDGRLAKSSYLHISRVATAAFFLHSQAYSMIFSGVYPLGSAMSVASFLKKQTTLDATREPLRSMLKEAGIDPQDDFERNRNRFINFAVENIDALRDLLPQDLGREYFVQEIGHASRPAWFDLGLRSTSPRLVADALNINWPGYLLKKAHFKPEATITHGYTDVRASAFVPNVPDYPPSLSEPIFSNPYDTSVLGYERKDGKVVAIVEETPYSATKDNILQVHAAILDYCRDVQEGFGRTILYSTDISKELFIRPLECVATNPKDIDFLSTMVVHEDDLFVDGKGGNTLPIVPEGIRDAIHIYKTGLPRDSTIPAVQNRNLSRLQIIGALLFGNINNYVEVRSHLINKMRTSKNPAYKLLKTLLRR